MRILVPLLLALVLSGCVRTAASIVTAPVRAVGQVADWATTSQDEADRNRGREIREQEERLGREWRECMEDHDRAYCDEIYYRHARTTPPEED
ncbi:MAG: hypothetical protein RLN87_13700 [Parasphingopyxis sp.]|uniref:hypothetical protein n=1 Tax=Parasphingopyxis sp. TaxID=1920299 RepID=UPI00261E39D8|nr:hypothetical protein [uncultured Parasphingopyxis sp.]